MTLALIVLVVLVVIAAPVTIADRAGRRRTDAADTAAAGQYWEHVQAAVTPGPTDYERTLACGFTELADAYADRITSRRAAMTEADAAAGHLNPTVPAQTRKEAS